MKLEPHSSRTMPDQVLDVVGSAGFVFFALLLAFFGWLKYRDRNKPGGRKPHQRLKRKVKHK